MFLKVFRDYEMEFQTQQLWKWRTDPPDFKFVIGSCSYVNEPKFDRPGEPYGSNFEIFKGIIKFVLNRLSKIRIFIYFSKILILNKYSNNNNKKF